MCVGPTVPAKQKPMRLVIDAQTQKTVKSIPGYGGNAGRLAGAEKPPVTSSGAPRILQVPTSKAR